MHKIRLHTIHSFPDVVFDGRLIGGKEGVEWGRGVQALLLKSHLNLLNRRRNLSKSQRDACLWPIGLPGR